MITQTKEQYTSPRCEELDARLEGVIAASPAPGEPVYPGSGFGTEKGW